MDGILLAQSSAFHGHMHDLVQRESWMLCLARATRARAVLRPHTHTQAGSRASERESHAGTDYVMSKSLTMCCCPST